MRSEDNEGTGGGGSGASGPGDWSGRHHESDGAGARVPDTVVERGAVVAGRYVLSRRIGSGGMGVVWEALDLRLNRKVAVKGLLYRDDAADARLQAELIERARREAQATARIRHQNVVAVHDVIEADSQVWIVMDLFDAGSLASLLEEREQLPVPQVARIGLQVLRGLRAAHAAQVLHRDVKPANILFNAEGQAMLMDFGIATFEGAGHLTVAGQVVGTPMYTAPELARSTPGGQAPAADLWSLGVTLYQAVEGRPPFRATTPLQMAVAVCESDPDPMRYAGPLAPVIEALLQRDPARRPDAARAEEMLRAVLDTAPPAPAPPPAPSQTPSPPAPPARTAPWRPLLAAALCLTLLGGGGWYLWNQSQDKPPAVPAADGKPTTPAADRNPTDPMAGLPKKLLVGVKKDQPALSMAPKAKGGRYTGFEPDIARALGKEMGYAEGEIEFVEVTSENRDATLLRPDVDLVIATHSKSSERKPGISVIGPYYKAGQGVMVRWKHRNLYPDLESLRKAGKEVCTARKSVYVEILRARGVKTTLRDTYEQCRDELEGEEATNNVYAVATDDVILEGFGKAPGNAGKFKMLPDLGDNEEWMIDVRTNDETVKKRTCEALQAIVRDGEWQKAYDRHLRPVMGETRTKPVPLPCPAA
ncbi:serine/threonine-protein kinase [Streptomyces termitum]|uniref:serine/threonine-protein kinase n=1 Tax=Streptomyces termitum TaxID=67368 RepID=UPI0037AAA206